MNTHSANILFHALRSVALPTWAEYERATDDRKLLIERAWRNAWRSETANALLTRAVNLKRASEDSRLEKLWAERIANAPKLYGPAGGYRKVNASFGHDELAEYEERNQDYSEAGGMK